MKNQIKYFLLGIIIILFSSPLGYTMLNIIYANKNLVGEFNSLLNGFIHSFMLIGGLIFTIGLANMFIEKKVEVNPIDKLLDFLILTYYTYIIC